MSLPGLSASAAPEPEEVSVTVQELGERTEWRFEVAFDARIQVKVLSGTAEIYGTELATNQTYTFTGIKAAIFTWHGCKIEVSGECASEYTAEETPMASYANLHFALDRIREQAITSQRDGPRAMIVGPENSGKTSLVKFLTAYALRAHRQPVVANLDPREGMLSVPGTLSAATYTSIIDVAEGWGSSPTNGPTPVPVKLPLVYYLGLESPVDNPTAFKSLTSRLALSVMSKLQDDAHCRSAGCIIDTPDAISQTKGNYELLQHVASEFSANVIVVIGSERLYSDLSRRFNGTTASNGEPIKVLKLDKSGGCVDRDAAFRQQLQQAQIREYFFGDLSNTLSPHTQQVDFGAVAIFRPVDASPSNDSLSSFLPGDYDPTADETASAIFETVDPITPQMQNSVIAIMHAGAGEEHERIRDASVIGFIFVADVDEKRQKLKILAPLSGRLPQNALVWGRWPEGSSELVG